MIKINCAKTSATMRKKNNKNNFKNYVGYATRLRWSSIRPKRKRNEYG